MRIDWILQIIICSVSMLLAPIMIIVVIINGKRSNLRKAWIIYVIDGFIWCSGMLMMTLYYVNHEWLSTHGLLYLIKPIDFYKYVAINTESSVWLLFCFSYCYKSLSSTEKKLYKHSWIVFIPAFIFYLFLINNEHHGMVYYWINKNGKWVIYFGLVSHLQAITDSIYHLWGVKTFLKHTRRIHPYHKKQWFIMVLVGYIIHLTCLIYFNSSLFQKYNNFDIVPLCFFVNLLVYNFVILKYRFLNITPVAFSKMTDELEESIFIIDANGIIAYFNRAFKENFCTECLLNIDDEVSCFTKYLRNNINMNGSMERIIRAIETESCINVRGEIYLNTYKKYYTVNVQPLYVKKDFIGRIITFYDITDYKKLLGEVENKNRELKLANTQLGSMQMR